MTPECRRTATQRQELQRVDRNLQLLHLLSYYVGGGSQQVPQRRTQRKGNKPCTYDGDQQNAFVWCSSFGQHAGSSEWTMHKDTLWVDGMHHPEWSADERHGDDELARLLSTHYMSDLHVCPPKRLSCMSALRNWPTITTVWTWSFLLVILFCRRRCGSCLRGPGEKGHLDRLSNVQDGLQCI